MIWIIMEIDKGVIHWTDNILFFFHFVIKEFLTFTYQIEIKKEKDTHTLI